MLQNPTTQEAAYFLALLFLLQPQSCIFQETVCVPSAPLFSDCVGQKLSPCSSKFIHPIFPDM